MDSLCVLCKDLVTVEDQAMACDICDNWEHIGCLHYSGKLSD